MDVIKVLKTVNNLNEYISITQDIVKNTANLNIQLNVSTVHTLKNLRSLEVEHFNKSNKNGAAFIIFEVIAKLQPSRIWAVVGKEMVSMIQYWLQAVRTHLMLLNTHWWKFLHTLLMFIQKIYLKHTSIINWLVEETSECLLDLATRSEPSLNQRFLIIQCFNKFCSIATREIRFAKKDKLQRYLKLLSQLMAECGDASLQYVIMETLVRWLLPRENLNVKRQAAAKWFPSILYSCEAVDAFLEKSSKGFLRDTRHFLNIHNKSSKKVVSVICKKLTVGNVCVISAGPCDFWLDVNCGSKCISLMLEKTLYKTLNVEIRSTCDAIVIAEDNTNNAQMYRGSLEILLFLKIIDPMQLYPSKVLENNYDVKASISPETDFQRLDKALQTIFDKKYQLLMDRPSTDLSQIEDKGNSSRNFDCTSDDSRFSNPSEILRRKQLEEKSSSVSVRSPSSASTTSLLMLPEKLSKIQNSPFNKQVERVSTTPQLRSVTEVTEIEERESDRSSLNTGKTDLYGTYSSKNPQQDQITHDNTQNKKQNTKDHEYPINIASPNIVLNKSTSVENIIDLLAKEALQYHRSDDTTLYGKNDFVNHTLLVKKTGSSKRKCDKKEFNYERTLRNDTTDESSTAFVENTPSIYANETNKSTTVLFRKRGTIKDSNDIGSGRQTFDNKTVEQFFSQHFTENEHGDLMVSPTLAKSINDSRLKSSDPIILCPPIEVGTEFNFNYMEVVECLDTIIDKVCENIEKRQEFLDQNLDQIIKLDKVVTNVDLRKLPSKKGINDFIKEDFQDLSKRNNLKSETVKGVKLKFQNTGRQTNIFKLKNNNKHMSPPITKRKGVVGPTVMIIKHISSELPSNTCNGDLEIPLSKRRRKLYSRKDDDLVNARTGIHISETEEDNSVSQFKTLNRAPKSIATCYKELQKTRKKATMRQLRNHNSKCPSPKTERINCLFDKLKNTIENDDNIKLINKTLSGKDVFNYTSASEDDDFKKTNDVAKRTPKNIKFSKTTRRRSKVKSIAGSNNSKKNAKRSLIDKKITCESLEDMTDERMREATVEVLNTSLRNQFHEDELSYELEPLHKKPRMMAIRDEIECEIVTSPEKKTKKRSKKTEQRSGKRKIKINNKLLISDKIDDKNKTVSPLPGLEIETVPKVIDREDSIKMLDNFLNVSEETHIILSESEQQNNSPPDLNVTEEFKKANEQNSFNVNTKRRCRSFINNDKSNIERSSSESGCNESVSVVTKVDIHDYRTKSVSTVGKFPITAHGVYDESPPNIKQLNKRISNRSLEIENLNKSLTTYYNKLTNDINVSLSSVNSQKETNNAEQYHHNNTKAIIEKLPTVSLNRLSEKDISRWLPPPCNPVFDCEYSSESDESKRKTRSYSRRTSNNENKMNNDQIYDLDSDISVRKIKSHVTHKSNNGTEMNRALRNISNNKDTQNVRRSIISPIKLNEEFNVDDKSVSSENSRSYRYDLRKYRKASPGKATIPLISCGNLNATVESNNTSSKKSMEKSPAIIYDLRKYGKASPVNAKSSLIPRPKIDALVERDDTPTKGSIERSPVTTYDLRKHTKASPVKAKSHLIRRSKIDAIVESDNAPSKMSIERLAVTTSDLRRRSESSPKIDAPIESDNTALKRPVEKSAITLNSKQPHLEDATPLATEPSGSSVDDWFKRNNREKTSTEDSPNVNVKEIITYLLEKLDTTLFEIQHNTSKSLINMFVRVQTEFNKMSEEREEKCKETALEILADIYRSVDKKFAKLDAGYKQQDENLMAFFKERAQEIVRTDAKQKHALVKMLKEDVQTVMDHISKKNSGA